MMKLITALSLSAALTRAFVVPAEIAPDQAPVAEDAGSAIHQGDASWQDILPSKEKLSSPVVDAIDFLESRVDDVVHAAHSIQATLKNQIEEPFAFTADNDAGATGGHHHHHGHGSLNLTIYQLISLSNHTKKFAKLVDQYPSVVKLLNSTEANYTLFVPVDEAFEHVPDDDDDDKPSKEFVEAALLYHIGLGRYPVRRILGTHTLPTALDEALLGDEPQRLRTSVGLSGVKVNFYSRIVAADVIAKNGIIHAVHSILVPPPFAGRELSLFPSVFSTLLLAYEKTDFVKYIHGVKLVGSTIFAPSNHAFARLGPKVNAFLFNTETGLRYLRALLKYHISPNATLYTDAFYDKTHAEDAHGKLWETDHYDLPTLLDDKPVGVDITRLGGLISVKVNCNTHASVTDGIAKNGVIHVVDKVLIPPHKSGHGDKSDVEDDVDLEWFKEQFDHVMGEL